ncbi:MAG: hypothetical protein ACO2PO_19840, partial [Candidatus Calescibacterium sp.]
MAKMRKSLRGERKSKKGKNKKIELFASFIFTSFFSLLLLILFPQKKTFATPLPVTTFPPYLQNSVVLRLTGCFTDWVQRNLNYLFAEDPFTSADNLCPPGQYLGTPGSFSSGNVSCGWKTLNFLNALLMDLLDRQKKIRVSFPSYEIDDPVMCCCNPEKDPENCTGPTTPGCPTQFPKRGKCMALKPEATNYFVVNYRDTSFTIPYVIRGYQAWGVTWVGAPGSSTAYWSGLLDQCIPIPLAGNVCINLSLNDVCNAIGCGPILNYNGVNHPGNCLYTSTIPEFFNTNNCDDDITGYMSQKIDNWILRYNPVGGVSINFSVGESIGVSCGMGSAYTYNGKTFTGNEGFITIQLYLNPISIDIDAATPSPGNRDAFLGSSGIYPIATYVAPGRTDCDENLDYHQGDCYVRAYIRARGALKLKIGATLYLEHRTYSWPHIQDVGIAIREINFSEAPWISLALDWAWSELNPNCTASGVCVRRKVTEKAMKTIGFIDVVLRGLFRFTHIPSGIRQYFGPVVFDISDLTQIKTSHFFPTWVRPITTDDLLIDIALGGAPYLGTQVLRSKSCFANNGVGPGTNRNELYLIGAAMIDLDLFRRGTDWKNTTQWYDHRITSCGYLPPPYGNHPAPFMMPGPTQFYQLPHAGSRDSISLTSCEGGGPFVGLSIFQNVFTYLVSDIAASGLMCLAIS